LDTRLYGFVLGLLCVWRITHLLQAEDGPWDLVVRLRQMVGDGFWGKLLDCFHCLSLWVAAPFAVWLGSDTTERLLLWPALSGAAMILERIPREVAPYWKEEDPDVVLRHEENSP